PLAAIPWTSHLGDGLTALFAALELLASRIGNDIGFSATQITVHHLRDRFPHLAQRLLRVLNAPDTVVASSGATNTKQALSRAHEAARTALRHRRYRGVGVLEEIGQSFREEVALPLLFELEDATLDNLADLLERITKKRVGVAQFVDQKGQDYAHPPVSKL